MIYYTNYSSTRYSQFVKPSNYSLTVPATSPAIGLESIKEHIKSIQGFEDYDSQLLSLIKVVTEYGEKITGRDFINKTYEGFLNRFPKDNCQSIEIRKSKLQSISSIQYLKDGVLTTFDPSKYYFTKSDNFSIIALEDGNDRLTVERGNLKGSTFNRFFKGCNNLNGVTVGEGLTVGCCSLVRPGTTIGDQVYIGANCTIDINVVIEEGVTIGDNVFVESGVTIPANTNVPSGSVVKKS